MEHSQGFTEMNGSASKFARGSKGSMLGHRRRNRSRWASLAGLLLIKFIVGIPSVSTCASSVCEHITNGIFGFPAEVAEFSIYSSAIFFNCSQTSLKVFPMPLLENFFLRVKHLYIVRKSEKSNMGMFTFHDEKTDCYRLQQQAKAHGCMF